MCQRCTIIRSSERSGISLIRIVVTDSLDRNRSSILAFYVEFVGIVSSEFKSNKLIGRNVRCLELNLLYLRIITGKRLRLGSESKHRNASVLLNVRHENRKVSCTCGIIEEPSGNIDQLTIERSQVVREIGSRSLNRPFIRGLERKNQIAIAAVDNKSSRQLNIRNLGRSHEFCDVVRRDFGNCGNRRNRTLTGFRHRRIIAELEHAAISSRSTLNGYNLADSRRGNTITRINQHHTRSILHEEPSSIIGDNRSILDLVGAGSGNLGNSHGRNGITGCQINYLAPQTRLQGNIVNTQVR